MAGGFINTTYKNISDNLIEGYKNRLRNPYYKWNGQNTTKVTYFNLSNTNTTYDEGSCNIYDGYGKDSSLRHNKIEDCYLYGLERITMALESGDFGLQGSEVNGTAITLPNTFQPYPQDYFIINHLDNKYVFRVNHVSSDTLENGQNFYQLEFTLDHTDASVLDKQVVDNYVMVIDNVGTTFKSVIKSTEFDEVKKIDDSLITLKKYYKALFYSDRVETFIFTDGVDHFYDPYLIEFIIKNKLMDKSDQYIYIDQKVYLPASFPIEYDQTFFRGVELIEPSRFKNTTSKAWIINDPLSIMYFRQEKYYMIDYFKNNTFANTIYNIKPELVEKIYNQSLYQNKDDFYKNIIIEYFYGRDFNTDYIFYLNQIQYTASIEMFYLMPIIIFILQSNLMKILNKNI